MQSYLINGVHKAKPSVPAALLQPLTPLMLVAYHKEGADGHGSEGGGRLQRVKEVRPCPALARTPFEIERTAVAQFMAEIADLAIQEVEPNEAVFGFFLDFALRLDGGNSLGESPSPSASPSTIHLPALVALTALLGFGPSDNYTPYTPYFDLREGAFSADPPMHPEFLAEPLSGKFAELVAASSLTASHAMPKYARAERAVLLRVLLDYYRLHLQGFRMPNSLAVWEAVFG